MEVKDGRRDLIYIAGVGRSGSTLLARMLGQIEGFASLGEIHHVWQTGALALAGDEICGCSRPYSECEFWCEVARGAGGPMTAEELLRIQDLKRSVDRVRYVPLMAMGQEAPSRYRSLRDRYCEALLRLYTAIFESSGAEVVVDATKDLSSLYLLAGVSGIRVTVIHLVRDPRGVAYSWSKKMLRPEFPGSEVYMARKSSVRLAGFWTYSNLLAELSRNAHPAHLFVRYEDLVEQPREWLNEICRTLGQSEPNLSFVDSNGVYFEKSNHTVKGNPTRFSSGRLELQVDEEWRQKMGVREKVLVTALTSPLLLRYGYVGP